MLTPQDTITAWLNHPEGGAALRALLARSGQDESVLAPVASFSLQQVADMSGGAMPADVIDDLVRQANGGEAPAADVSIARSAPAGWTERITPERFAGQTVVVTGPGPASVVPRRPGSCMRAVGSWPSTSSSNGSPT